MASIGLVAASFFWTVSWVLGSEVAAIGGYVSWVRVGIDAFEAAVWTLGTVHSVGTGAAGLALNTIGIGLLEALLARTSASVSDAYGGIVSLGGAA